MPQTFVTRDGKANKSELAASCVGLLRQLEDHVQEGWILLADEESLIHEALYSRHRAVELGLRWRKVDGNKTRKEQVFISITGPGK